MSRRTFRSVLVVALASASLSGCWLQVGFDAGHTGFNRFEDHILPPNVATLAPVWSADLQQTASEPMVRGNRVFLTTGGVDATSGEGAIDARAFDAATGTLAWNRRFITLCCRPGVVYTPAAFVGDEMWTGWFMLLSSPRPVGGFRSPVRLDPADGSIIGSEENVATSAAVEASVGPPADGERVVVQTRLHTGTPSRSVVVRDSDTLETRWTAELPGSLDMEPVAPAVQDGQVFVADRTSLSAFPLEGCGAPTCTPTWTLDLGNPLKTVVAGPIGREVFTISGDDLVAVSRATGTVSWTASLGAPAPGLAMMADTVYVAAGTTLHAFAGSGCGAPTCTAGWTAAVDAGATASPIVAGGVVYVGGNGAVGAFPAHGCGAPTCDGYVTLPVAGPVDHLSLAGGRLFVVSRPAGTGLSRLTAFAPTG